jgi:hypothetical protein
VYASIDLETRNHDVTKVVDDLSDMIGRVKVLSYEFCGTIPSLVAAAGYLNKAMDDIPRVAKEFGMLPKKVLEPFPEDNGQGKETLKLKKILHN